MVIPNELNGFVRQVVRELPGVTYNKSPDLLKDKMPEIEIAKLNGNENQYGCSPKVSQVLAQYKYFNTYPDYTQKELRKSIAEYTGTVPENIVVTAGADQLLDVLTRLFIDTGDEVINCTPSYEPYRLYSQLMGGKVVEAPRDEYFNVNVDLVFKAITKKTKLIILCTPNNPTGNIIPEKDILKVADTGIPVVVDEAYYEFSGLTILPWLSKYPNIMIMRTFSKWAGMAGFRLGYGIMAPELVNYLYTIKPPFSVSGPAVIASKASMEDKNYLLEMVKKITVERDRVLKELSKLHSVKAYPSKGNFVFFEVLNKDASQINKAMEDVGILIRHYNNPRLRRGLRITIGRPEQNKRVLSALKEMLN
jgi:histidinol-phosphate aminotransferase